MHAAVTLRSHHPRRSFTSEKIAFPSWLPHPPNNQDESREPNPNMHPTSSRATLVFPRDLLPARGSRQSSPGSRPRATPEALRDRECPHPASLTLVLPQITRPGSASRFPPRSSHLDSLSPSPPRSGASSAVLSLSQRLSPPGLRSTVCACAHPPGTRSPRSLRGGPLVAARLPLPGPALAPASPGQGSVEVCSSRGSVAARGGAWPRHCGVCPEGSSETDTD